MRWALGFIIAASGAWAQAPVPAQVFDLSLPEDRLRALAAVQQGAQMPSAADIEAATRAWISPEALRARLESADLPLAQRLDFLMRLELAGEDKEALASLSRALTAAQP